jgi:hypothetical protein
MLRAVLLGQLLALGTQVLLHGWVNNQLLTNKMAGQLPDELILPSCLGVIITSIDQVVVAFLNLTVVLLNRSERLAMMTRVVEKFCPPLKVRGRIDER